MGTGCWGCPTGTLPSGGHPPPSCLPSCMLGFCKFLLAPFLYRFLINSSAMWLALWTDPLFFSWYSLFTLLSGIFCLSPRLIMWPDGFSLPPVTHQCISACWALVTFLGHSRSLSKTETPEKLSSVGRGSESSLGCSRIHVARGTRQRKHVFTPFTVVDQEEVRESYLGSSERTVSSLAGIAKHLTGSDWFCVSHLPDVGGAALEACDCHLHTFSKKTSLRNAVF